MPERPDLRAIAGNIREALAECDRESLLDILTFVFKEYVIEGPPPLLVNQVERLPDLEGLSFAQLISALQTRLDHAELSLFQVDGDRVSVRVGGTLAPIGVQGAGSALDPRPAAAVQPAAAPQTGSASQPATPQQAPRPTPGVRVVETTLVRRPPGSSSAGQGDGPRRGDMAAMAQQAVDQAVQAEAAAPPPRRGVSIRGRSGAGSFIPDSRSAGPPSRPDQAGGPAQARQGSQSAGPPGQDPANPPTPAPTSSEPDHPGDEDGSSTRFSLLELD
ncbi:MAG: hypothetical protein MJE77_19065 [Proteobacteria bacterium]|nr:hypothetical protein [Pseudomonadota bacterium]